MERLTEKEIKQLRSLASKIVRLDCSGKSCLTCEYRYNFNGMNICLSSTIFHLVSTFIEKSEGENENG